MSHEIEKHDQVVLTGQKAWHGLGIVVEDAPTAAAALKIAGLDWEVEQWPLVATQPVQVQIGDQQPLSMQVSSHLLNVRMPRSAEDKMQPIPMGIVGKNYQCFQNAEMAAFVDALVEGEDRIQIESAGSIRNGQKVWFLIRGESFSVRATAKRRGTQAVEDKVATYILCSNGFDGCTGFRCTPTMIRVVCSNTLHAVIPSYDPEGRLRRFTPASFVCRHCGTLAERVEEAKKALGLYVSAIDESTDLIDQAAAKDVSSEMVQQFFLESYTKHFGSIPGNPETAAEQRLRDKAITAQGVFQARWDQEEQSIGASAWAMLNAYTGYLQHDITSRLKDEQRARDVQVHSQLFATNASRSLDAWRLALTL